MTQAQIKELFGVAPTTLKDWKNNPKHGKHNLGLYLVTLDYKETKTILELLKKEQVLIMDYIETGVPCAECGQEYVKTEDGVGGCLNTSCGMKHPQTEEILRTEAEDDAFNVIEE